MTPVQHASNTTAVTQVRHADLDDLLPLIRSYCAFYDASPSDESLRSLTRSLLEDDVREGVQFIARDANHVAVGFATVFWSWSTLSAARIAVMNDLFVCEGARGCGVADALIASCTHYCRLRGDIARLVWQTAKDNFRAQAVYSRIGATRSEWIDYAIDFPHAPNARGKRRTASQGDEP